jgi:hypothetical protein
MIDKLINLKSDWLRKRIAEEPDICCDIYPPEQVAAVAANTDKLEHDLALSEQKVASLKLKMRDNAMLTELSSRSYSLLEKKYLKLQQERDNAMLLHADTELRFNQYILRTENEKAIAARLPHSRGLHPRVAALKGVHTEDGKETKIKS